MDLDDPDYKNKKKRLDRGWKPYRLNHVSWWQQELPAIEEMEEGRNNLAAHDNRNVDEKKILLYEQIIRVV